MAKFFLDNPTFDEMNNNLVEVPKPESQFPASRLSILVIVSWPPEPFIKRLIDGLADNGVDVTVADSRKPDEKWLSHPRHHWLFAPSSNGSFSDRLTRFGWMISKASVAGKDTRRLLRRSHNKNLLEWIKMVHRFLPFVGRQWDVVYFPWISTAIKYLPFLHFACPILISCRGRLINIAPHNPKRPRIRKKLPEAFGQASAVHCVSEAIKAEALQYGLNPGKVWIIRPAADLDSFGPLKQAKPNDGIFRIISVGSLIWRKGYEYAMTTLRLLLDQGVPARLEIIGNSSGWQRTLFTMQDLGLEGHVELHGRLNTDRVRDRLQNANVFLHSSLSEGISNAVLEAMACALPIVTTDCGGMREAITDGVEGFVVPVRDTGSAMKALLSLYQDRRLREEMGLAARKKVMSQFSLDQQIVDFTALCNNICSNN